jgi:hypothetical protein
MTVPEEAPETGQPGYFDDHPHRPHVQRQVRRERWATLVIWIVGAMLIYSLNMFSLAQLNMAVDQIEANGDERTEMLEHIQEIVEDTNEISAFTASAQSPEGRAEQDERLNALVQGVRAEVNCDNRDALHELAEALVAAGIIRSEDIDLLCPR